jgi:hypothetical protein
MIPSDRTREMPNKPHTCGEGRVELIYEHLLTKAEEQTALTASTGGRTEDAAATDEVQEKTKPRRKPKRHRRTQQAIKLSYSYTSPPAEEPGSPPCSVAPKATGGEGPADR